MARNVRYFETEEEFNAVYGNSESGYTEPWVAYIEETEGVAYSKPVLTAITLSNVRMLADVPASGGTVTVDDLTYKVTAKYDNFKRVDVTSEATVTGASLNVASSWTEERHSAGTMSLTAEYGGLSASSQITVYQEAFVPSVTGITLDELEWVVNIPASGGTATSANCSFEVNAHYDNETEKNITALASVTGYLEVSSSSTEEVHSAGTLTLTATYEEFSASSNVTVYQEAYGNYLKFNILSGGNIAFGAVSWNGDNTATTLTIEYKKNDGEWTNLTSTVFDWNISAETREDVVNSFSSKFSVDAGDVVMFRGNNQAYAFLVSGGEGVDNFNTFFSTARFNVEGNIMSLIDKNNYDTLSTLTAPATFSYLFSGCYRLISAENLLLPAMTLTSNCYDSMFYDLIGDADWGFDYDMGLTTAPELPATTLAYDCYSCMFAGCTSLTTALELPATTLASYCYQGMFYNCTSLAAAPELPVTTLAMGCYRGMFNGCTSLNYIKCLATDISATNCTTGWVNGVQTNSGTFVKNPNMSSWTTGSDGVPSNWTVQDAS